MSVRERRGGEDGLRNRAKLTEGIKKFMSVPPALVASFFPNCDTASLLISHGVFNAAPW